MVVCPIALAVGCNKCPAVSVCPLKTTLGDYKPPAANDPEGPGRQAEVAARPAPSRAGFRHHRLRGA